MTAGFRDGRPRATPRGEARPILDAASRRPGGAVVETLESAMRRALALAARAGGRTSPNPMVGAVALDPSGRIIAEGFHRAPGRAHAEAALLEDGRARGVNLRGATLVCTLEPCAYGGRTPPCAPAVAAAGFARVAIAMRDPNPLVDGRGVAVLREAGADVLEGVGEREARRLNEGFLRWIVAGRPFVHLKVAMLPDGTVYRGAGQPRGISGFEARAVVHVWRHSAPAVLVGSGTVRTDDPLLTARELPASLDLDPWQPRRIVLASRFDVPAGARALRAVAGEPPPLVIGADDPPPGAEAPLEALGVATLRVPAAGRKLDLAAALEAIGALGVTGVLVEGGPVLSEELLARGLVDRLSVFLAPAERPRGSGRRSERQAAAAGAGVGAEDSAPGDAGRRAWTPPGGLPFTGASLMDRQELQIGRDRLVTGLVPRSV